LRIPKLPSSSPVGGLFLSEWAAIFAVERMEQDIYSGCPSAPFDTKVIFVFEFSVNNSKPLWSVQPDYVTMNNDRLIPNGTKWC
jgi:hypothetical protein